MSLRFPGPGRGRTPMLFFAAVLFLIARPLAGQEKQYEQPLQEVLQTELVYPQERGEVQLTFAPRVFRSDGRRELRLGTLVEYGLTDAWQVSLDWDPFARLGASPSARRGVGDLSVGTKYSFMRIRGSDFHAAIGFDLGLPAADPDQGLGEGTIQYAPYLILAKDFPRWKRAQVFTQAGIGLVQRVRRRTPPSPSEPAAHAFDWNTGVFVPYKSVRFTAELNWTTNRWNHAGEENQLYVTPGLVWELPGRWELGAAVALGLNQRSDRSRWLMKLTREFDLRKHP